VRWRYSRAWRTWERFETFHICFFRFFHRVWRYRRVLAHDYDFDWAPLTEFMELKLRSMADSLSQNRHVGDERRVRQCRVAAELCRRLRTDAYRDMHGRDYRRQGASEHIAQKYLGLLIGKHLSGWWE
jgi:hypothetical protein